MQITHEEAHRLIDFKADGVLQLQQRNLLDSHLNGCAECQRYAHSIDRVESVLRPMLQRQWSRQPVPLSNRALGVSARSFPERMVVATRIAAVAVVCLAFFIGTWNFTVSSTRTPTPFLQSVPLIPTPFTSTVIGYTDPTPENCPTSSYTVQQNDTLASIANRFAVSTDEIVQLNSMRNGTVKTGETLLLPGCNFTPTHPALVHTTTFTPVLYSSTTTPDG